MRNRNKKDEIVRTVDQLYLLGIFQRRYRARAFPITVRVLRRKQAQFILQNVSAFINVSQLITIKSA